jgi:hypothetical protein
VTGAGWGQDPFGGSPFGGDPFGGGPAGGSPWGGNPGSGGPASPPSFTPPPTFGSPHGPGGGATNTLATLSVIFAFLFAPAGAVLGHLGLRQIARTGQRGRQRAIVGIALSYSIIVLSVVALVVWAVIGDDATTPTAEPTRTFIPSTPTPTSSTPTTTTSAAPITPPALNPGRTVDAADLPALLLGIDAIKTIMGKGTDAQPVPNLTVQPPTTALVGSPGPQGSMDPADCAPAMISASETGYRDSGYRAVYSVTMTQPGAEGEQSVTQSVLAFPDAATARQALLGILQTVQRCAVRETKGQATGYFTFTEPDGGVNGSWGLSALNLDKPTGYGNLFYDFQGLRFKPDLSEPRLFYTNERTLGLKGNAIVDVSVRGLGIFSQPWDVISEILKNLT